MTIPQPSSSNHSSNWDRFCDLIWFNSELDLWLDISRMHLDNSDLSFYQPVIQEAINSLIKLENGAISNIDEDRQVGHYWLRNPALAPDPNQSQTIIQTINLIKSFGKDILENKISNKSGQKFTDVIWIGIGGSSLGPLLICNSFYKRGRGLKFHFLDNIDPDGIHNVLSSLEDNIKSTLCVVVSKSGGTPEPRLCMNQVHRFIELNGGHPPSQSVAITMRSSQLDVLADNQGWLKRFDLPDWVGGRTSITSAVGLLPAVLIGESVDDFLLGAAAMDKETRNLNIKNNPASLLALSWYLSGSGKGLRDMVVLPYKDCLSVFSRYLQQLIMESLGKKYNRKGDVVNQGIAVYGNKGSTDQHAYVQQLRDGLDNFFVNFIEILEDSPNITAIDSENPGDFLSGFLQGTRKALSEEGRQNITITSKKYNIKILGSIIALFERAVGIYAEMVDINAYHQPGVEAGKLAAAEVLDSQLAIEKILSDKTPRSVNQLESLLDKPNSSESIYWIMRHLTANNNSYYYKGEWEDPKSLIFGIR